MFSLSSTISDHIRFLLQSYNDSNLASVVSELYQLADYGSDGCILLLQACLDQVNFCVRDMHNMLLKPDLLSAIFGYLLDKPNFSTVMCEALRSAPQIETYLDLSNTLPLSLSEKIAIGLALSDAENPDFRKKGQSFCVARIEELCSNPSSSVSRDQIYDIVMFFTRSEGLAKYLDSFIKRFLLQHEEKISFILDPMLMDDLCEVYSLRHLDFFSECVENDIDAVLVEVEKEMSMADIMTELGYGCTIDASHCKEMLSLFLPLNEVTLARVLSTIARTHVGLDDSQNIYSTFVSSMGYKSTANFSWPSSWNVDVLVDSINQLVPETNWTCVMENLDHDGFYIPDENAFCLFMSIYANACQDPFPLHAICGSGWKNTEGQLSFLRYAVSAPPEIFTFAHTARKLPYVDALPGNELQHGLINQAWFCLDLLEVLCQLAERGHASSIQTMFQDPLKHCPEALLMGIAHINTLYNLLQYEVSSIVFPMIVGSAPRSCTINNIWHVNPSLVLRGFVDVHNTNPDNIGRILDICHDLKILSPVLDMTSFCFSIKLAALASQNNYLDLEKWLDKNLSTYQNDFFEGCLKFLKELPFDAANGLHSNRFQQSTDIISVRPETSSTFFKVLRAHSGQLISYQLSEDMKRLHVAFMHANSRLQRGTSTNLSMLNGFPEDIEAEVNSLFNHMFLGNLTIDAMVQMLAHFKDSFENREKLIFDCMIYHLFEEFKFFPRYPGKQLKIAAIFLGSLINLQVVTDCTLSIAQFAVLDALRQSVDSKMFMFGVTALEQFVERLLEWPQYGLNIVQISHLRGSHAELVAIIEQALSCPSSSQLESNGNNSAPIDQLQSFTFVSKMEASASSMHMLSTQHPANAKTVMVSSPCFIRPQGILSGGMVKRHSHSIGFGTALKIDTLIAASERKDTPIEVPSLEFQEKVLFMFNNISTANMDAKAAEFTEVLKEQCYPWFAQYMVMKRASIEPNFHDLYLSFLDKINSRALNLEIVKATYENCKVLLRSELIKSSSEERSLLKNLGSWLGKFTIGRNQVLRARDIDPKKLIIEAYEKGLMIAVIPFSSKILEPCQWSRAYRPPNPWTMAILRLLVEIYAFPNLKMNLKFDIEVLFKHLGVDMKDLRPTSLLKDRVREVEGNPDFSTKDFGSFSAQPVVDLNSRVLSSLTQVEFRPDVANPSDHGAHSDVSTRVASSPLGEDKKMGNLSLSERLPSGQGLSQPALSQSPFLVSQPRTSISDFGAHAVINPKLNALDLQLHLQRVVEIAFDRTIKQVLSPVVHHSVTIAGQTTRELILKDYVMESDESHIYNAAHLMVETLTGSLALVTCKEKLCVVMSSHMRSLLQNLNLATELLEQAVQIFINDNLNPMCKIIVQAATNKALQIIDGEIAPTLAFRRKQREEVGSAFYDASTYSQGPFALVPEALRPKPGRLSIAQQQIYEDFVRFQWKNQLSQSSNTMPTDPPELIAVTHPLDLVSESIDTTSALLFSTPSSHVGIGDGDLQHTADTYSAGFASTVASPELPLMKPSSESETVIQLSPTPSSRESLDSGILEPTFCTGNALDKYQIVAQKLKTLINNDATDAEIQGAVSEVSDIILRCVSRDEAALAIAQKVFKSLHENASNHKHIKYHLAVLVSIQDVCKLVTEELTRWVIFLDEGRKLNINITVGFIRSGLLNLTEYTVHLSKLIDGGRNKAATEFSISLLQKLVAHEPGVCLSEFYNLIDSLGKLAMMPRSPESLQKLIDIARNHTTNAIPLPGFTIAKDDKSRQDKKVVSGRSVTSTEDYNLIESAASDLAGFRDQVTLLFTEWHNICETATDCSHYISQLQRRGLLKGDDISDRFFHILTELSVSHCIASEMTTPATLLLQSPQDVEPLSFVAIDMYAKLVVLVVKHSMVDQGSSKISLLLKILSVTVRFLQKDAEEKKSSFNPRPYFRLFVNWLLDLCSPDSILEAANFQILVAFANAFHAVRPSKVPGWSFAWLELVSHRSFMPKLLMNTQKGWPCVQHLLVDLFKFMEPYLRDAELREPVDFLYKGTLRVLLVLLHDFPEFLCDHHFSFCNVIPPKCIQMRNVILSAYPRNMRLPDPSLPNLKIDLLAEIIQSPRILSEIDGALKEKQMKTEIDEYFKTRQQGSSFLTDLKKRLLLPQSEAEVAGPRYNVPLINSLVLYVGMQAIQKQNAYACRHATPMDIFSVGPAIDIFQTLIEGLDTEGRYLFLNALVNQLRYPNNHTYYFSFILLYFFAEGNQEIIQEQITRILLERLIANRPHPWGVLITFLELIKNPQYNFWNRPFIRCAPEMEKLFESVSRSCFGSKATNDTVGSVGFSDNH